MKTPAWELTVGNETILFQSEMDATSASAALMRGVTVQAAADPLRKRSGVVIVPCEVRTRKVEIDLKLQNKAARIGSTMAIAGGAA